MEEAKRNGQKEKELLVGGEINDLIFEIKDGIEDLKRHRISRKNPSKVLWKTPGGRNITATDRANDVIRDFLKLQKLVKDTSFNNDADVKNIRLKVGNLLNWLGLSGQLISFKEAEPTKKKVANSKN